MDKIITRDRLVRTAIILFSLFSAMFSNAVIMAMSNSEESYICSMFLIYFIGFTHLMYEADEDIYRYLFLSGMILFDKFNRVIFPETQAERVSSCLQLIMMLMTFYIINNVLQSTQLIVPRSFHFFPIFVTMTNQASVWIGVTAGIVLGFARYPTKSGQRKLYQYVPLTLLASFIAAYIKWLIRN